MSHIKSLFMIVVLILFSVCLVYSQNPEWIVYDTSNSGLTSNNISCIAIDDSGNKWIGTVAGGSPKGNPIHGGGLVKFAGTNWSVYDSTNSGLAVDAASSIVIDKNGNKWMGVYILRRSIDMGNFFEGYGLAKFEDSNWTVYDTSNSDLPSNNISCIAIDDSGNMWIGTSYHHMYGPEGCGLTRFDGTNWAVYDPSNSGLPGDYVGCIAIDANGNKWMGTGFLGKWPHGTGLALFDGTNWTVYDTSNSGLPSNQINCIAIDANGNKWIGTIGGGLAVFKEGGVVSVEENSNPKSQLPSHITLYQNYPNPFNPTTTIEFAIPTSGYVSLKVFNITGQEVATLVNKELSPGTHKVEWNPQNLSSGLYFYKLETKGYHETKKLILMK